MADATQGKITAKTGAEICQRFKLGDDAKELLREGMAPKPFLDVLLEKNLYQDAARFLAHALPKREAVWWACLCARLAHGAKPEEKIAAAIQTAEKWAVDPSDDNRRAAFPAAEKAELRTPAGCAAMAAFWSGGSLAPPNLPVVPPKEELTGHGVSCAVMLAAVLTEPEKAAEKYARFFKIGLEVAAGTNRWK